MTMIPVTYPGCYFSIVCMGLQIGINLLLIIVILLVQNYCYWKIFFGLRKHSDFQHHSTAKPSAAYSIQRGPAEKRISDDHREFLSNLGWSVVVYSLCAIPMVAIWTVYIRFLLVIPQHTSACDTVATEMDRLFNGSLKIEMRTMMILTPCLYIRTIVVPMFVVYKNTKVKQNLMGILCRKNVILDNNDEGRTQQPTSLNS